MYRTTRNRLKFLIFFRLHSCAVLHPFSSLPSHSTPINSPWIPPLHLALGGSVPELTLTRSGARSGARGRAEKYFVKQFSLKELRGL